MISGRWHHFLQSLLVTRHCTPVTQFTPKRQSRQLFPCLPVTNACEVIMRELAKKEERAAKKPK